jgi:hypothetical protein
VGVLKVNEEYSRIRIRIWTRIRIHTKMSWIRNNVPDKTCRHHTFGGTYARVGHAVDGVEDLQPYIRQWHQWPATSQSRLAPLYLVSPHCHEGGLRSGLQRARTSSWPGWPPSWRRRCLQLAPRQPRQEVRVERSSDCLPTGQQPETRRALFHRSPLG